MGSIDKLSFPLSPIIEYKYCIAKFIFSALKKTHPTVTIINVYKYFIIKGEDFKNDFTASILSTIKNTPCHNPHNKKTQLAPCHIPHRAKTTIRLKYVLVFPFLFPPKGMYR